MLAFNVSSGGLSARVRLLACALICATALLAAAQQTRAATVNSPNAGPISIPTSGVASPYPSTSTITGTSGVIADVNVRINDFSHTWPDDVAIVLQAPNGQTVGLMADRCGSADMVVDDLIFDDSASAVLSDSGACSGGTYDVTAVSSSLGGGAPAAPYGANLRSLNGASANGAWKLWVIDDSGSDSGSIVSWSVQVVTAAAYIDPSAGPSIPYPLAQTVSGMSGPITDVNVLVSGITHGWADDLDVLLKSPSGKTVLLMSDACGGKNMNSIDWLFDDGAPVGLSDSTSADCDAFAVRPSNFEGASDTFPSGPVAPFGSTLSVFNGDDANGVWQLYIYDDVGIDGGFFEDGYQLQITTQPPVIPAPVVAKSVCDGLKGRALRRCKSRQACLRKYKAKKGRSLTKRQKAARKRCLAKARKRR